MRERDRVIKLNCHCCRISRKLSCKCNCLLLALFICCQQIRQTIELCTKGLQFAENGRERESWTEEDKETEIARSYV